jgi:hypothetical protein
MHLRKITGAHGRGADPSRPLAIIGHWWDPSTASDTMATAGNGDPQGGAMLGSG